MTPESVQTNTGSLPMLWVKGLQLAAIQVYFCGSPSVGGMLPNRTSLLQCWFKNETSDSHNWSQPSSGSYKAVDKQSLSNTSTLTLANNPGLAWLWKILYQHILSSTFFLHSKHFTLYYRKCLCHLTVSAIAIINYKKLQDDIMAVWVFLWLIILVAVQ